MRCRDCPYGKEDFERRMANYERIIEERGIPNDIYGSLQPEDVGDDFEQFLWCDKVGGKVYCFGHCTDFYENEIRKSNKNHSNKKRSSKRERDKKYKEHLKSSHYTLEWYPSPVKYVDEIWLGGCNYIENPKPYYKREYRGKRSKYLKKQSNRKIRKYKGDFQNGFHCHKVYDFWFELY